MSHVAGGGDKVGEVRSERDGRWGVIELTEGGGERWRGSAKIVWRWQSGRPAWTWGQGREEGATGCSDACS
jgi:hypothetical protein